jgi:hypothetical protein
LTDIGLDANQTTHLRGSTLIVQFRDPT